MLYAFLGPVLVNMLSLVPNTLTENRTYAHHLHEQAAKQLLAEIEAQRAAGLAHSRPTFDWCY